MSAQPSEFWVPEDSLSNRLVLVRMHLDITQREAAARCGVTYGEWQGMEQGRASRNVHIKVERISNALGVSRDWLMWGGPLHSPGPEGLPRKDSNLQPAGWPIVTFGSANGRGVLSHRPALQPSAA